MSAMRINHLPRVLKSILPVVAFFAVVIAALAAYGLSGDDTTVTELSTESGGLLQESPGIGGQGGTTITPAATSTAGNNLNEDFSGDFGEDGFWYGTGDSALSSSPSGSQGADTVLLTTGIIRGHILNFSDNCFADNSVPCAEIFAYRADRLEVVEGTETGTMLNGIIVGFKGNAFSFDSLPAGNYKLLAQPGAVIYNNNIASTITYKKTWYRAPGSPHSPSDDIVRERYSPSSGTWESATVVTVTPGGMADVNITMGIMTVSAVSGADASTSIATSGTDTTTTGTAGIMTTGTTSTTTTGTDAATTGTTTGTAGAEMISPATP